MGIEEGINGPKKHKEEGKTERTGGKREIWIMQKDEKENDYLEGWVTKDGHEATWVRIVWLGGVEKLVLPHKKGAIISSVLFSIFPEALLRPLSVLLFF